MCVKGEPRCILVCSDRVEGRPLLSVYSLNWEPLQWLRKNQYHKSIPKPFHLQEMIDIEKKCLKILTSFGLIYMIVPTEYCLEN